MCLSSLRVESSHCPHTTHYSRSHPSCKSCCYLFLLHTLLHFFWSMSVALDNHSYLHVSTPTTSALCSFTVTSVSLSFTHIYSAVHLVSCLQNIPSLLQVYFHLLPTPTIDHNVTINIIVHWISCLTAQSTRTLQTRSSEHFPGIIPPTVNLGIMPTALITIVSLSSYMPRIILTFLVQTFSYKTFTLFAPNHMLSVNPQRHSALPSTTTLFHQHSQIKHTATSWSSTLFLT